MVRMSIGSDRAQFFQLRAVCTDVNVVVSGINSANNSASFRINQLDDSVKQLSSENAQLLSTIQEKEEKLIFSSEFQKQTDMTSAKVLSSL